MYFVRASLMVVNPVSGADLRAHLVKAAVPEDGLEHVYAEVDAQEARLVLFVRQDSAAAAEHAATRLCRRLLAAGPCLVGWSLVACTASTASSVLPRPWAPCPDGNPGS